MLGDLLGTVEPRQKIICQVPRIAVYVVGYAKDIMAEVELVCFEEIRQSQRMPIQVCGGDIHN